MMLFVLPIRKRLTTYLVLGVVTLVAFSATSCAPEPLDLSGISERQIPLGELTFDVRTAGPEDGELVLLLHGFPQTSLAWRHQLKALGDAGYFAVAPNQRGYSPGARPSEVDDYRLPLLVDDVLGLADALGRDRFHLGGHDWGAVVAWAVAADAPGRVLSLTSFSIPHSDPFAAMAADPTSCQSSASAYVDDLIAEGSERNMLALGGAPLRYGAFGGLHPEAVDHYLEELGDEEALRAAVNWYRANATEEALFGGESIGPVAVDTLFIWSDGDPYICRDPVDATADYVTGAYRLEVLEGVDHWIPENAAETVSPWLLEHVGAQR
jgi:pimeloyl-ACP methyl ester carboxylesterase